MTAGLVKPPSGASHRRDGEETPMAEKKASNGTGARTSSKDTRKVHGSEGKKGRVDDEPTEEMIRNVMHFGVIEPIVVRKNQETGKTEVVAGRKRTKACREANRR